MSGKDLIDDYLSELMDDPDKGAPDSPASKRAEAADAKRVPEANGADNAPPDDESVAEPASPASPPDSEPTAEDVNDSPLAEAEAAAPSPVESTTVTDTSQPPGDPLAAFRDGASTIDDDEFEAMLDALNGKVAPVAAAVEAPTAAEPNTTPSGDPLAAFREGSSEIGDDEFEAMLDALQGKPASAAENAPAEAKTPAGDPLETFRQGGDDISDDEFEAMLDALSGQAPVAATATPAAPAPASTPAAPAQPSPPAPSAPAPSPPVPATPHARAVAELASQQVSDLPEKRRRAEDKVTAWLRFSVGRQCFAVEVLKVQEVLRVPSIMPVRGTGEAMLGVMNLRGQIVPVMDTGIRLGFGAVEVSEASRVVVLEESGEALGLLVSAVADVINLAEVRIERISGTPSLVNSEVVRGISRREGAIIILLDATRILAL